MWSHKQQPFGGCFWRWLVSLGPHVFPILFFYCTGTIICTDNLFLLGFETMGKKKLGILLNEGRLSLVFFGSSNRYIERVETGRLKSIWCLWTSLKKTSVHFKMLKTILLIAKIVLSWEKYGKSCICMWIDCKELASLVINCATSKKPYERDATYLQIIAYNTIAFYFDFIVVHLSYMC